MIKVSLYMLQMIHPKFPIKTVTNMCDCSKYVYVAEDSSLIPYQNCNKSWPKERLLAVPGPLLNVAASWWS